MDTYTTGAAAAGRCRVCGGDVTEFLDLGRQPLSDAFLKPTDTEREFFFRLAVGLCTQCTMVQLMEEVPRNLMFHEDYPYYSSGSTVMREHFAKAALALIERECQGDGPFFVEIGCNDGVLLRTVAGEGVRHLGFEPSTKVAEVAAANGVNVRNEFFEAATAASVRRLEGLADVIFAANTFCHIPYVESVLSGVKELLAPTGVFVFEDPYLGDIVAKTAFDQIYDEHFYFFSAQSVHHMAAQFGLELVNVERYPVHGGQVRYSLAHAGARPVAKAVTDLLAQEADQKLSTLGTLREFARNVTKIRGDLGTLLRDLRAAGKTVAAYGATAKSATVTNFCGIGPDLVSYVCDTTPAKQHRVTPGTHIPVQPPTAFTDSYPDYALLFAWNHAEEIMAKEREFTDQGGRWIMYVPHVHVV